MSPAVVPAAWIQAVPARLARALVGVLLALLLAPTLPLPARAQGVELSSFELKRQDGALTLDYAAQLVLPRPVEDALQRGVPVYFVAEAQVLRARWYWRDERVARVSRAWRLAFQPLTSSWRVSFGGLNQSFATQAEALAAVSRGSGWKLVELAQLDPGSSYSVEFRFRLDNSLLPSPMQISLGAQTGWTMGVERTQRVE